MLVPGHKLGRYELIEPIGSGGMSAVWRAHDPVIDRDVALKVLAPELARDENCRQRFQEEARALAQVNHRNLVRVYVVGQEGPLSFYTMELVAGRPLSEVLSTRGRFRVQEALAVFAQMLAGLEAVHLAGIVHRDVKPGNIMIDPSGRVVLMDFGLARRVERQRLTLAGAVLGTPEYMSPEQARGEEADARSDLYSAGVVLFEMIGGRPPFVGKDTIAILRQHVEAPPPALGSLASGTPADLSAVVARLLAKSPAERYSHVVAVREALAARIQPEGETERLVRKALDDACEILARQTRTAEVDVPAQAQAAKAAQAGRPRHKDAGQPREVTSSEVLRTWMAVFAAVIAVIALMVTVALVLLRPARDVAPLPPPATPPAAGARWNVTRRDGTRFVGRLVDIEDANGADTVWVFRLPEGRVERIHDGELGQMEQVNDR